MEYNIEHLSNLLRGCFPAADEEEIETYLFGPDDPWDYFGKIASEQELFDDFELFLQI